MRRTTTFLAVICVSLLQAGCLGGGDFSDLDARMADARNQPKGEIEPLPTYPPPERFTYKAMALRSPFDAPIVSSGEQVATGNTVPAPDASRPKELLETFNFTALSMVGTLSKAGNIWGLVNDGEGRIHRVSVGDYLGKNYGKIVSIDQSEMKIQETVPDGKGDWINRPRTLAIDEE